MGTQDYFENEKPIQSGKQLVIDSTSANYMFSIMKKVNLVTIVGIVFLCSLVIVGVYHILFVRGEANKVIGTICVIVGCLFLFFSAKILSGTNKTKQALMYSSKNKLNEGLKDFNLVATFQFILTIICLAAILITYIYSTL